MFCFWHDVWWLLLGEESQSGGQSHGGERRQVCPSPPGSDDSEYTYLHLFSNSYAIQQEGKGWGWVGGEGWVGEVPECHPLLCVYPGDDTLPHVKQKRKKLDVDMLAYHFPRGLFYLKEVILSFHCVCVRARTCVCVCVCVCMRRTCVRVILNVPAELPHSKMYCECEILHESLVDIWMFSLSTLFWVGGLVE